MSMMISKDSKDCNQNKIRSLNYTQCKNRFCLLSQPQEMLNVVLRVAPFDAQSVRKNHIELRGFNSKRQLELKCQQSHV